MRFVHLEDVGSNFDGFVYQIWCFQLRFLRQHMWKKYSQINIDQPTQSTCSYFLNLFERTTLGSKTLVRISSGGKVDAGLRPQYCPSCTFFEVTQETFQFTVQLRNIVSIDVGVLLELLMTSFEKSIIISAGDRYHMTLQSLRCCRFSPFMEELWLWLPAWSWDIVLRRQFFWRFLKWLVRVVVVCLEKKS